MRKKGVEEKDKTKCDYMVLDVEGAFSCKVYFDDQIRQRMA